MQSGKGCSNPTTQLDGDYRSPSTYAADHKVGRFSFERSVILLYLLLSLLVVGVDQIVKYFVRSSIPLHTHVDFLPGFDLTYVQNTGAAFSIFSAHTWLLTLISALLSLLLLVAMLRKMMPRPMGMLSLSLLLGGAVGNLIDRALFGFVTDMFATNFMNFAVFNVADIGVVVGGILLCLHVLLVHDKQEPDKEESA